MKFAAVKSAAKSASAVTAQFNHRTHRELPATVQQLFVHWKFMSITSGARTTAMPAAASPAAGRLASPERLTSLDGLRGIAAAIVMVYHLSLVARPFIDTGTRGDLWWWLTATPLKLFTAGTEAVLVFFVLSGLVVTLPALKTRFGRLGYYGARLLRLYLPVWGALALAALLIALLPRDAAAVTPDAWISRANPTHITLPQWLSEASLWKASYDIDNVLWSLRWELVFSLSLPLFVIVARAVRKHWQVAAAVAVALTVSGRVVALDAVVYLPVFFLGALIAVRLPDLRAWSARRSRLFWLVLMVGSSVLLVASWLARPLETKLSSQVLWGLSGLGAAGLVIVAIGSPLAVRTLSAAVPRWLGKISFSLYLVQAPIIATVAFALGDANWPLVAGLAIPLCLLTAWLFHSAVEKPSHRLARAVGRRLGRRAEPQLESTDKMLPAGSRNQAMSGP